ncbi:MAG: sulfatase-like hydrolase/transferase [Pseudomonadota bacterium]
MGFIGLTIGGVMNVVRSAMARAAIFACLTVVVLDFHYQFLEKLNNYIFASGHDIRILAMLVTGAWVAFALPLLLRDAIGRVGLAFFGVVALSSFLAPVTHGSWEKASFEVRASSLNDTNAAFMHSGDRPLIVHLVLDGFLGLDGFLDEGIESIQVRNDLERFFSVHQFQVYGGAYSQYFMTHNALANLYNGESQSTGNRHLHHDGRKWVLIENLYFERLAEAGYALRILQSNHMDFCHGREWTTTQCETYPSSSIGSLKRLGLPLTQMVKEITGSFLTRTFLYPFLVKSYESVRSLLGRFGLDFLPRWDDRQFIYYSLEGPEVFDRLNRQIMNAGPGQFHFAHILLPHAPYFLTEDCQVKPDTADWTSRRLGHSDLYSAGTLAYRVEATRSYMMQVQCVRMQLERVFFSLKRAGLWDDTIVLIQGDHGSRITLRDPVDSIYSPSHNDLVASYSSMFAIKVPGRDGGYDGHGVPMQNLFSPLILGREAPADLGVVFLEDPGNLDRRRFDFNFGEPGMPNLQPALTPDFSIAAERPNGARPEN